MITALLYLICQDLLHELKFHGALKSAYALSILNSASFAATSHLHLSLRLHFVLLRTELLLQADLNMPQVPKNQGSAWVVCTCCTRVQSRATCYSATFAFPSDSFGNFGKRAHYPLQISRAFRLKNVEKGDTTLPLWFWKKWDHQKKLYNTANSKQKTKRQHCDAILI